MRRKKATRPPGSPKPLSAHEAGKISPRSGKDSATPRKSVNYDDEASDKPAERLTVREEEMLSFVAVRQSNAEIARRENITEKTVEKHIENIYRKIPVNSRADAVAWYWMRRYEELRKSIGRGN
ncbi:MAG: Bacterial regulatory protein luxR family [Verrucomicrobiota bacterium]|jgi:DNA-binding CsgD family transcriptional regulator